MGISDRLLPVMFSPLVLNYNYFLYTNTFWFIQNLQNLKTFLIGSGSKYVKGNNSNHYYIC
jgi:hypothetical protein